MEPRILVNAFKDAGYKCRPYSGRGMYGQECVGVVLPRGTSLFVVGLDVAYLLADLNVRELRHATDSLGVDQVLYFPLVPWLSDMETEEEGDEDDD